MENSAEPSKSKFNVGDRVSWDTVNGLKMGVIERFEPRGILIRLPSGKIIYAHENSLTLCSH